MHFVHALDFLRVENAARCPLYVRLSRSNVGMSSHFEFMVEIVFVFFFFFLPGWHILNGLFR